VVLKVERPVKDNGNHDDPHHLPQDGRGRMRSLRPQKLGRPRIERADGAGDEKRHVGQVRKIDGKGLVNRPRKVGLLPLEQIIAPGKIDRMLPPLVRPAPGGVGGWGGVKGESSEMVTDNMFWKRKM
jgi:hypothetical protein